MTHDLNVTLQARTPSRKHADRLWKRHGEGSTWAWEGGDFVYTPAPRSKSEPFRASVGTGNDELHAIHLVRGLLVVNSGAVQLNHYAAVNSAGEQIGVMMWQTGDDTPITEAWFHPNQIRAFLAHHPYGPRLKDVTIPSLAEFKDRYPGMHEQMVTQRRSRLLPWTR